LQALEGVREQSEEFAELRKTIEDEGVNPLKEIVAQIIEIAIAELK